MVSIKIQITDPAGLHLGPAEKICRKALGYQSRCSLRNKETSETEMSSRSSAKAVTSRKHWQRWQTWSGSSCAAAENRPGV